MTPTRLTPERERQLRTLLPFTHEELFSEIDALRVGLDLARMTAERDAAMKRGRELVEMHDEQIARAEQAEARERALREALDSIANSSCCGSCQEAARVAKKALAATREEPTT